VDDVRTRHRLFPSAPWYDTRSSPERSHQLFHNPRQIPLSRAHHKGRLRGRGPEGLSLAATPGPGRNRCGETHQTASAQRRAGALRAPFPPTAPARPGPRTPNPEPRTPTPSSAHPASCTAPPPLSRPWRRAPRPNPETPLPSATPEPEKSSLLPDCAPDLAATPGPALFCLPRSRGPRDLRHQAPERRAGAGAGRREVGPRVAMATPGAPEPRDAPAHPRFRPASRLGGLSARLARLWGLRRRPFPLPMAAAAARCRMGVAGPAHKQESLQARGGRHRLCTRHAAAHSGPRRREDARAARRGPAEPRARRGGRPSPPPPRTRGTRKRRRSATATSAWGAPGLGCAPAPQVRGIPRLRFRPRITTSDQQTPVYKEPRATVSLLERKRCGGNASVFHPGSDDTRLRFYQRVERRKVTSFVVTPAGVDTSTELEQAGLRGPGQCFPVNLLVSSSVIRLLLMLNFPYREIIIRG
jgi:hypothetical protein